MSHARRVPLKAKRPKKVGVERRLLARITDLLAGLAAPYKGLPVHGPPQFIQLVAGGGYNILYALDASGQVWKFRHAYDKSTKETSDERWVPVSMERRDK